MAARERLEPEVKPCKHGHTDRYPSGRCRTCRMVAYHGSIENYETHCYWSARSNENQFMWKTARRTVPYRPRKAKSGAERIARSAELRTLHQERRKRAVRAYLTGFGHNRSTGKFVAAFWAKQLGVVRDHAEASREEYFLGWSNEQIEDFIERGNAQDRW
jgi:hypothetical protein